MTASLHLLIPLPAGEKAPLLSLVERLDGTTASVDALMRKNPWHC